MKWTPGPWISENAQREHFFIAQPLGFVVAKTTGGIPGRVDERANAHLIAAAPELYEALDALVKEAASARYLDNGNMGDKIGAACAALAKARGDKTK